MSIDRLKVDGLFNSPAFSQVVVAEGSKTVYISGQVAWGVDGRIVGVDDFDAQAMKAYENLGIALRAAGATPADVVKTNIYIVNYNRDHRPGLEAARTSLFGDVGAPASTLIGVQALAMSALMIEVEAIAVID